MSRRDPSEIFRKSSEILIRAPKQRSFFRPELLRGKWGVPCLRRDLRRHRECLATVRMLV